MFIKEGSPQGQSLIHHLQKAQDFLIQEKKTTSLWNLVPYLKSRLTLSSSLAAEHWVTPSTADDRILFKYLCALKYSLSHMLALFQVDPTRILVSLLGMNCKNCKWMPYLLTHGLCSQIWPNIVFHFVQSRQWLISKCSLDSHFLPRTPCLPSPQSTPGQPIQHDTHTFLPPAPYTFLSS